MESLVNKTYYMCYKIFDTMEDIEKVSSTLNHYIDTQQWNVAHYYLSTLKLTDKEFELLIRCVDSYRDSC